MNQNSSRGLMDLSYILGDYKIKLSVSLMQINVNSSLWVNFIFKP